MSTLLKIDSSPRGDASVSRQLTAAFADRWLKHHPDARIIERDLYGASPLPLVDVNWIGAAYTPPAARTPEQNQTLAVSETLIQELQAADEYVFGVPMYNFSIPAAFKSWIDQVVRAGRTFSYTSGGSVEGLIKGKKATVIISSGGVYQPDTPLAVMDFVIPYLRTILGFIGITNVEFIAADGLSKVMQGQVPLDQHIAPTLERVLAHASV
ncbi:FMN-dependent NADH-azoreductase [Paracidobacterium acidisoli]|nr:FMN-dependent NADH-azoreductase [Paracidobacterium acidisoli]MBT9330665.1 FMN-dependent NADH-azoreductase [Paracidobacterium acidisoli]